MQSINTNVGSTNQRRAQHFQDGVSHLTRFIFSKLITFIGDGSSRELEDLYPFLLMIPFSYLYFTISSMRPAFPIVDNLRRTPLMLYRGSIYWSTGVKCHLANRPSILIFIGTGVRCERAYIRTSNTTLVIPR